MKIMRAAMRSKIPDINENMGLLSTDGQTFPEQCRLFPEIFGLGKPNGDEAMKLYQRHYVSSFWHLPEVLTHAAPMLRAKKSPEAAPEKIYKKKNVGHIAYAGVTEKPT